MSRVVALVAFIGASVLFVIVLYARIPGEAEQFSPTVPEIWLVAIPEDRQMSYIVEAKAVVAEAAPIRASRITLTGLVTSVGLEAGDVVRHGDIVATVDLVPVYAFRTRFPFYRNLSAGDRGDDVLQLNQLLFEYGYLELESVDDRFGNRTTGAVKQFNEEWLGLQHARDFDVSRVVWLPADSPSVESIVLEVGMLWPGAAAPLINRPAEILAIEADFDDDAALGSNSVLVVSGSEFPATSDSRGKWRVEGPFDPLDVSILAPAIDGVSALLREAAVRQVVVVPLGAVLVDSTGQTCIFQRSSGVESMSAVVVVRSLPGELWLKATFWDGQEVLMNPTEAGREIGQC